MKLALYSRIRYIGPSGLYDGVKVNDVGYIIEDYDDGNYEVEFSDADGSTRAQSVIPEDFLQLAEI
ncbi:hypothetical protein DK254_07305 [Pseudomonas sp. RW407]|uniref:DUF4926 domain-containing protein n=1 Tax=Pseudomonas sp. RW407 TaxID=2202894 RepID=UPI000D6F3CC3|nr:DUF4926 domain-containing protein [Pseudomonas sp. RW407]PWU29944.1 hypothetical protein DK254_07305 [Pseudomonas sp. RW407]